MNRTILKKLFLSTLYLSTFTFGGGYVIISLLKNKFVDELGWIDQEEMLDLTAIAQSSPGAIAVNGAIVVGYKLAGIPGILCSIAGAILPPFAIISVISYFYTAFCENFIVQALLAGMSAGVGAVIISVVYDMGKDIFKSRDPLLLLIMAAALAANCWLHVNVVFIILCAAGIGLLRALPGRTRSRRKSPHPQTYETTKGGTRS